VPIQPPVPEAVDACKDLCLDPFVLVLVLDQTDSIGTYSAQLGLQVLKEYAYTGAIKKVSIISFGDKVCPQTITFDNTIQEAIDFLQQASSNVGPFYCDGGSDVPENGIDALFQAANILRDYKTSYNKYIYFVTDTADFNNNTIGAFSADAAINAYCDKAWMIIGGTYQDANKQYADYIAESAVVKYDYFPSCIASFEAYCDAPVRSAGVKGVHNYTFNGGAQTGPYNITYSNINAPARFTVSWGPSITGTCFIGDQTYNAALTALGYSPIATPALTGALTISKARETPANIKIVVETPFDGSDWQFTVRCYGE
jgi:hypothetical protein